jgi:hypothetical protein
VRSIGLLVVIAACKSPPVEQSQEQAPEPRPTTQSLTDKWANVDAPSLPKGGSELAKGRAVLVITIDPTAKPYEPGLPGTCFAARADDVRLVVVAKAHREPMRKAKTGAGLHDKTWHFDAIAVPEGKVVASWDRFSMAEEVLMRPTSSPNVPITPVHSFALFPRAAFDADCSSLQAGTAPAQD